MLRTRVGYTGGSTENPTYRNLSDHSETIQIDYDPGQISYEELLKVFWQSHNPASPPYSQQYKSAVFYNTEEQKEVALQSKRAQESTLGKNIYTEILPLSAFYLAEEYHQKFNLRQQAMILQELKSLYPNVEDFVNSPVVTKLNGYFGGHGSLEDLEEEIMSLDELSDAAKQRLVEHLKTAE